MWRAKPPSLGAIPPARSRDDTTPRSLVQLARSRSLGDLNREPLGLRRLSSTTKVFGCDYNLARAEPIDDYGSGPPGVAHARWMKKAAA